jgi:hypothetical protein
MNSIEYHFKHIINIFLLSIFYFIIIRLVSVLTFKIFPKFKLDDTKNKSKQKIKILTESLIELGIIGSIIYIIRTILEYYGDKFASYKFSNEYEKYIIFVLNPALFSGPSHLKNKLDYVLSYDN